MFDARRFLKEKFHNPPHAHALLEGYGFRISLHAVEKWFQRATVPGQWWPILIAILELERGAPQSVASYLAVEGAE